MVAYEMAPPVISMNPPIPVPMSTPTRKSSSLARSRPESARAIDDAATAICEKRAMRCAALRSMYRVGSNPCTSQANFVVSFSVAYDPSTRRAVLRPSMSPSQYSSRDLPRGFTVPIPVTTTRTRPFLVFTSPPQPESYARVDSRRLPWSPGWRS